MLIAGDIGGTKTDLAVYSRESGPHAPLAQAEFPSAHYPSLQAIVREFLARVPLQVTAGSNESDTAASKIDNVDEVIRAGANIVVSGSGIFSALNYRASMVEMRERAEVAAEVWDASLTGNEMNED